MNEAALKPGRELDALVAEKVMGWKDAEGIALVLRDGRVVNMMDCLPWSPSTEIAAAWEVVEKVGVFTTKMLVLAHDGRDWVVCDEVDAGGCHSVSGRGESAPHAICLAAMKAVGHELS